MNNNNLSATPYMSPRTSALRRLDSTRDVRHGSVVIQRNEVLTSMDPSRDPLSRVHEEGLFLNLTSRTNDTITVEWTYCPSQSWMGIDHFLLEHSSVTNPDFVNVKLASNERQYCLRNCTSGTNNFFVISSIDVYGKVIIRSKQLTVQSSAPIDRPTLKLKKNLPNSITIEWNRPTEYGDGFISEYHIKVDGKFYTNARSTKTSFDFIECRPLENYTFRIQALSIKHDCNSEWSNVLEVACPAALPIILQRLRPDTVNIVTVGWNLPKCKGGAKVKEFKVYFKEASTYELYNDQEKPDPDKIFGHRHAIVRSYKPDATESTIKVDPRKSYWAILRADIIPEGCPAVITLPVRVCATIRPVPPQITLEIYGQRERMEANREIAMLLGKRDKIKRRKNIFQSNNAVAGAQLKNDEIQDMNVMLYQIEIRMQELVSVVNKITGFVPVVLKWNKPLFDEFSEPSSYRITVDDHSYQNHLPLDCTEHSLKLDVEKLFHKVSVATLSSHPVGHSEQSNVEVVPAKQFRPNRFFCYFTSHNKAARWPSSGACRLEDFLAYEKKLTCKKNVHRGLLKNRLLPKPYKVLGIHDDMQQLLIRHFSKKTTIILFWTKWCVSSQNMLELFSNFAHQTKDKYVNLACCVESGEDSFSHRKSVIELLNEKSLRVHGNIRHCCACHTSPDFTAEKTDNVTLPTTFDLDGVPTFFILDNKGRLAWQGRVAADSDDTFCDYMVHVMSQVNENTCPTPECQHCKDEEGVMLKPKEDGEKMENNKNNNNYSDYTANDNNSNSNDDTVNDNNNNNYSDDTANDNNNNSNNDTVNDNNNYSDDTANDNNNNSNDDTVNDNNNNNNNNNNTNTNNNNNTNDKFSLDEFHLLHSRLHGQGLEEAEKTQGEEYAKLGTLSPRKEWLERRRANAKAHTLAQSASPEHEKQKPRAQGQANSNQTSPKPTGNFRNYKYRQPERDYRSPNNGYARAQYGYGGSKSVNFSAQKPLPMETPRDSLEDYVEPKSRRGGYQYLSVNYHNSEKMSNGDHEDESEGNDRKGIHPNSSKATGLGYQSSQDTPQWTSAIKTNRVSRDTSRDDGLSSTWPRSGFEHQQEDVYKFEIPTNMRGTKDKSDSNGLYPEISKDNHNTTTHEVHKEIINIPYIYRKPSLTQSTTSLGNREKKKDRFSHIQSRYSAASYKPGNPRRRQVAASGNRRRSFVQEQDSQGRRTPGRGYSGIPRDQRSQNTSKSARYNRRQESNY